MYFIVGKCVNAVNQLLSYIISDGDGIKEVSPQQVYIEFQKGNLPAVKNISNGVVSFNNIDNSALPTFVNGKSKTNSVSVINVLYAGNTQVGATLLLSTGLKKIRMAEIIQAIKSDRIKLFNAKLVNNTLVAKYGSLVNVDVSKKAEDSKVITPNKAIEPINDDFIKECFNEDTYCDHDEDGVVTEAKKKLRQKYDSKQCIIVPDDMERIPDNWQKNNKDVEIVIIGNNTKAVGKSAFEGCSNLKYVLNAFMEYENGITMSYIDKRAFANCTKLKHVGLFLCDQMGVIYGQMEYWEESVLVIEQEAFINCINLEVLNCRAAMASVLCNSAFENCKCLHDVHLSMIVVPSLSDSVINYDSSKPESIVDCTDMSNFKCCKWRGAGNISYDDIRDNNKAPFAFKLADNLFKGCESIDTLFINTDPCIVFILYSEFLDKICYMERYCEGCYEQLQLFCDDSLFRLLNSPLIDDDWFFGGAMFEVLTIDAYEAHFYLDLDSIKQFKSIRHIYLDNRKLDVKIDDDRNVKKELVGEVKDIVKIYHDFIYLLPYFLMWALNKHFGYHALYRYYALYRDKQGVQKLIDLDDRSDVNMDLFEDYMYSLPIEFYNIMTNGDGALDNVLSFPDKYELLKKLLPPDEDVTDENEVDEDNSDEDTDQSETTSVGFDTFVLDDSFLSKSDGFGNSKKYDDYYNSSFDSLYKKVNIEKLVAKRPNIDVISLVEECYKHYKKIYAEARKKYNEKYGINKNNVSSDILDDIWNWNISGEIDLFI